MGGSNTQELKPELLIFTCPSNEPNQTPMVVTLGPNSITHNINTKGPHNPTFKNETHLNVL
jgi:hypothetical protein